jgi:polar amino acid transport system substrate-binding protein
MVTPKGKYKALKELLAAGSAVRASILANVYADDLVHRALPQAQVLQLDGQANVFQAITAGAPTSR